MPRIVRFHELGGPEVLRIEELDVPLPAKGEVRMKVKALGLNRAEALFRAGRYLEQAKLPSKLGYEASGIVDAVGPDVKDLSPGDIVSVIPSPSQGKYGVYGEMAIVPANCIVKHPSTLSFEEAAAIWMQYLTAHGALIDVAQMTRGDFVIITAASSSVGLAAIQLANRVGAIPIATTRTSQKKSALEKAGAKYVIATQEEKIVDRIHEITKGKGARLIFDPVAGKGVSTLAECASQGGILIEYGALSGESTPFPMMIALPKGLTMRGYVLFELLNNAQKTKEAVNYILEGLKNKSLKPLIAKTFKLDDIVESHRYLESNQQFGKIVVTV
jgi:NADPH:quinone reductase-like Zn-dependent oxidoreductase